MRAVMLLTTVAALVSFDVVATIAIARILGRGGESPPLDAVQNERGK